jgi:hypothetical protein
VQLLPSPSRIYTAAFSKSTFLDTIDSPGLKNPDIPMAVQNTAQPLLVSLNLLFSFFKCLQHTLTQPTVEAKVKAPLQLKDAQSQLPVTVAMLNVKQLGKLSRYVQYAKNAEN